jgi:hypothetical protein
MFRALFFVAAAISVVQALPIGSNLSTSLSSPMTCEVCEASLGDLVHEAVEAGWMGEFM